MIPPSGRRRFLRLSTGLASALLLTAVPAAVAHVQAQPQPRVRLIATGGTIANRAGARLSPAELVRLAPTLDRHARVDVEAFANVSSGQLTLDQWLQLSRRIATILSEDAECAGVVVTSGTDTLEELAYFLHLTVHSDRPVVVVGSMRPPDAVVFDGAANLVAAVRVAAAVESRGRGTLVVMNEEIHGARDVSKIDVQRLDAFQSRHGRLGTVDADRVAYARRSEKRGGAQSEFDLAGRRGAAARGHPADLSGRAGRRLAPRRGRPWRHRPRAGDGRRRYQRDAAEAVRYALIRRVAVVTATRTGAGRVVAAGEPGA